MSVFNVGVMGSSPIGITEKEFENEPLLGSFFIYLNLWKGSGAFGIAQIDIKMSLILRFIEPQQML